MTIVARVCHWTASADDPSGANAGIARLVLRAGASGYTAEVHVRDTSVSFPSSTRTGTAVVRVGDDCWSGTMPCQIASSGRTASCKKLR